MENNDMVLITVGLAVLAKLFIDKAIPAFAQGFVDMQRSTLFLINKLNNWKVYLTLFIILLPFIIYWNYQFNISLFKKKEAEKIEKRKIEQEKEDNESFLESEIPRKEIEDLEEYIKEVKEKIDEGLYPFLLGKKLKIAKQNLNDLKRKKELYALQNKKEVLKEEIKELEIKREKKSSEESNSRREILKELDYWGENFAFRKEDLTEKQIEALSKEGYVHVNEYCSFEKKVVPAMAYNELGHSATHVFLVWSVKRILEEYPEITSIREHLTRDADLTFRFKNKTFALEIETGTLLKKKKQLEEKIKYLNRKYGKRWMIIVTKRDLIKKYKKLGHCTPRKDVQKNLRKLLKTYTPNSRVSKQFYIL